MLDFKAEAFCFTRKARACADGIGFARGGPNRHIGNSIARVIEAAFAKGLNEPAGLCFAREIGVFLRSKDAIEETEMCRNALCVPTVACRREVDRPAFGPHARDQLKHRLVIGEQTVVDLAGSGEIGLEGRLAAQQRASHGRMMLQRPGSGAKIALIKKICLHEGPVEIDNERKVFRFRSNTHHLSPGCALKSRKYEALGRRPPAPQPVAASTTGTVP